MAITSGSYTAEGSTISELALIRDFTEKDTNIVITKCFTFNIAEKKLGVEDYKKLRENIATRVCPSFQNVMVLPETHVDHFIILLNGSEGKVYFLFGVGDLYLKAYRRECDEELWWALDQGLKSRCFKPLEFNESYSKAGGLGRTAKKEVSDVKPSKMHLDMALTCLLTKDPATKGSASGETNQSIAGALLLCTIMLAEGIRFHNIAHFCIDNYDNDDPEQLGADRMELVKNWGKLSKFLPINFRGLNSQNKRKLEDLAKYVAVIKYVDPKADP